jgi:hypothetical protein
VAVDHPRAQLKASHPLLDIGKVIDTLTYSSSVFVVIHKGDQIIEIVVPTKDSPPRPVLLKARRRRESERCGCPGAPTVAQAMPTAAESLVPKSPCHVVEGEKPVAMAGQTVPGLLTVIIHTGEIALIASVA